MNQGQYEIFPLLKEDYEEAMKFTSTYYVSAEPISLLLNITAQEFANAYQKLFMLASTSGLSYGFKKEAKIVAVALVLNYKSYSQPIQCIPNLIPIQVLIQSLLASYTPQNIDKTAAVFVVTTQPSHKNKGLCSKLIEKVQKKAIQLGIEELVADCTNPIAQNIFIKAGFRVTNRIYYNQFQIQGKRPLQDIKFAESIIHVSKLL